MHAVPVRLNASRERAFLTSQNVQTLRKKCDTRLLQALQLGQDANSFNGQRCQMCLRSDTLHKVMERLANPGIHFICPLLFVFAYTAASSLIIILMKKASFSSVSSM